MRCRQLFTPDIAAYNDFCAFVRQNWRRQDGARDMHPSLGNLRQLAIRTL